MRKYIIALITIVIITFIYFYINKNNTYSKNMFYMDTYINIKIYSNKSKKDIDKIYNDIDKIYSKYDKLADAYQQYDEIKNVYYLNNILKDKEEIEIDKDLFDLIKYGISYYEKSDGLVNIASFNVTSVWKKYMNEGNKVPSYDEVNKNIDINDIKLFDNKFIKYNNVKLDLGAIAKGYVTEIVGNYLEDNKISMYLINAGGNIKLGNHYNNNKYIIGIEDPTNTNNIYHKLKLENMSIATSGDYQRYYEVDGIRYHHIIDLKTLYPANYSKSVTVITEDASYADVMSTYLFLLDSNDAINIVNNLDNVEAIIYIDKDHIIKSKGLVNYE